MARPSRLHQTAQVSKDLERTRAFYEQLIGSLLGPELPSSPFVRFAGNHTSNNTYR